MKSLCELQREIEAVRKRLNVVAGENVRTEECYQASVQLDRLIEDYMQYTKEKYHLRSCG